MADPPPNDPLPGGPGAVEPSPPAPAETAPADTAPAAWWAPGRLAGTAVRLLSSPAAPAALLGAVTMASVGARVFYLDQPCTASCKTGYDHALIFDEKYYVNAARRIDGFAVQGGDPYSNVPAGADGNAEHPQLGKLFIAAGMKLFGNQPAGWRLASLIAGTLAILAMYWLIRSARGGPWLALGGATLMAVDNLLLVHGRIATLDIFVVVAMMAGVALYLRDQRIASGASLGVACCIKLVAPYAFLVLVIIEALRVRRGSGGATPGWRPLLKTGAIRFGICLGVAVGTYLLLLFVLDRTVPAYDPGAGVYYRNPFSHTQHMWNYAKDLTSPSGPTGIASYPWQWLLNQEPINYFRVDTNVFSGGKQVGTFPVIFFQGAMNPFIIFLVLPGLALALAAAWRHVEEYAIVGSAWCLGTFLPNVVQSGAFHRTSYLYYMVPVMPGVYMVVAELFRRLPRPATVGWACALGYGFQTLYPFRTWSGH